MFGVVVFVHILVCAILIGVVLLQQGKGADMGAVFGGSSSTVFGSSGAGNFLTRLTAACAAIFMLTSIALTYVGASRVTSTVFDEASPEPPPLEAPAVPDPGAAAPAGQDATGVGVAPAPEGAPAPAAEPQAAAPAAGGEQAPAAPPEAAAPAAGAAAGAAANEAAEAVEGSAAPAGAAD
jgi:preprotein translocase subunit SecG